MLLSKPFGLGFLGLCLNRSNCIGMLGPCSLLLIFVLSTVSSRGQASPVISSLAVRTLQDPQRWGLQRRVTRLWWPGQSFGTWLWVQRFGQGCAFWVAPCLVLFGLLSLKLQSSEQQCRVATTGHWQEWQLQLGGTWECFSTNVFKEKMYIWVGGSRWAQRTQRAPVPPCSLSKMLCARPVTLRCL